MEWCRKDVLLLVTIHDDDPPASGVANEIELAAVLLSRFIVFHVTGPI